MFHMSRSHNPNGKCVVLHVTHHSIDGHVKNSPGPHDIKQAVDVLENGDHHLIFIFGAGLLKYKIFFIISVSTSQNPHRLGSSSPYMP